MKKLLISLFLCFFTIICFSAAKFDPFLGQVRESDGSITAASGSDITAGTSETKVVTPKAMADAGVNTATPFATSAEVTTGTSITKAINPKALKDANIKAASMAVAFYSTDVTLNQALDKTIISNRNATSNITITMDQLGSGAGKLADGFEFGVLNESQNTYISSLYTNSGGAGNRTSIITTTTDLSTNINDNDLSELVNGNTAAEELWVHTTALAGKHITWDFGTGKLITEIKFYDPFGGTWQLRGSNNGVIWGNIGTQITLENGAGTYTHTEMSANASSYRYYQLYGISGTNGEGWTKEIEFKIGGSSDITYDTITLTPDQTTPDQLPLTAAPGSSLQFSHEGDFGLFRVIDGKIRCISVFPAATNITDLLD